MQDQWADRSPDIRSSDRAVNVCGISPDTHRIEKLLNVREPYVCSMRASVRPDGLDPLLWAESYAAATCSKC